MIVPTVFGGLVGRNYTRIAQANAGLFAFRMAIRGSILDAVPSSGAKLRAQLQHNVHSRRCVFPKPRPVWSAPPRQSTAEGNLLL